MLKVVSWFGLIVLLALAATVPPGSAEAAVQLISFTAVASPTQVTIRWVTATEFETAGFYVQRSLLEQGPYLDIPDGDPLFFPSAGDGITGAEYVYNDLDVTAGTTYYYKLHVINYDEQEQFFGPISAIPGGIPTPTMTASPTSTATATVERSQVPVRTATLVRSATPPRTVIVTASATLTLTYTPTVLPTATPTETSTPTPYIIPAVSEPAFAYPPVFIPPSTSTPFVPGAELSSQSESDPANPFLSWSGLGLGAVLLVWLLLAFWWVFFSSRITR